MENEDKKPKPSDVTKGEITILEDAVGECTKKIFTIEEQRRSYRRAIRMLKERLRGEIAHERIFDAPTESTTVITDKKVEELKKKLFS